jgi:hypothetical protein
LVNLLIQMRIFRQEDQDQIDLLARHGDRLGEFNYVLQRVAARYGGDFAKLIGDVPMGEAPAGGRRVGIAGEPSADAERACRAATTTEEAFRHCMGSQLPAARQPR